MIIRISSAVSPSLVLGQFSSVLVMHHRFLPISTGRCCVGAARGLPGAGRAGRTVSAATVVSQQTAHISPTPLGTSAHGSPHQDALIYRLHIQPFISLYPPLARRSSPSLFNFPLKNRSHIKQPSMAGRRASPGGAKE